MGRFETLVVTRTQLSEREVQARELQDHHRGNLQRELDRQNCLLMHNNNRLSQLQTELDLSRADTLDWVTHARRDPYLGWVTHTETPTRDPYLGWVTHAETPTRDPNQRPLPGLGGGH